MPKLLQINTTANWGSTGKIAEQIGLHAMKHGWESTIAYGYYLNPSQSQLIKIGSKWSVRWHRQVSKYGKGDGRASRVATRKLIKQIEVLKPDIIHLHNIHGLYLNYPLLFDYLNGIETPVVWTMHDCWPFTGRCAYFDAVDCTLWQSGCKRCPALRLYPKTKRDNAAENFSLKERLFTAKQNMVLVPVSEWLGELVTKSMLKGCRIEVIHNGIDLNTFTPTPSEAKSNKHLVLGVAAQWGERKGLGDFYKLREMLDSALYDIVLIGLSEEQIAALPAGITGIRRTQNARELAEYYTRASVFANPTYSDNYPTTNLEAMACGTPVVTYRTGGSPEAVTTTTGIIVEQGNSEALGQAIKEICANGKEHYFEECRQRAAKHFDKEQCFERYVELYNELLTKNR